MIYLDFNKSSEDLDKIGSRFLIGDVPLEEHIETLITEDTTIRNNGIPIIVYYKYRQELSGLIGVCDKVRPSTNTRSNGIRTHSRIFGYAPRQTMRRLPCRTPTMAYEHPKEYKALAEAGILLSKLYKENNPELWKKQYDLSIEKALPEYRMEGDLFTSGILNIDNPLRYHYDAGNYKSAWSCMITLKRHITGGYLSIPDFSIGFELGNQSVLMFDGQSIMHGVTPFTKNTKESKRYTIVYYSLQQIWKCLTYHKEIRFMNEVQIEMGRRRLVNRPVSSHHVEYKPRRDALIQKRKDRQNKKT